MIFNEDIVYKDRHQVESGELWLPVANSEEIPGHPAKSQQTVRTDLDSSVSDSSDCGLGDGDDFRPPIDRKSVV